MNAIESAEYYANRAKINLVRWDNIYMREQIVDTVNYWDGDAVKIWLDVFSGDKDMIDRIRNKFIDFKNKYYYL